MKRIFFTIVLAFGLVLMIESCTNTKASDDNLYEQSIENEEIQDGDI